jgi:3-dehydroquinate synthase
MVQAQDFHMHPVFYGEPGVGQLGSFLDFHTRPGTGIFILTDENTRRHCLPVLLEKWPEGNQARVLEIPAGEATKNLQTCEPLWQSLTNSFADRHSILINLGGGVVCDLGGFTASVFKRGIRFIHCPTSLMAMCDAAIGGKTGVDLGPLKNMIGTFSQPMAVFIDPDFLETLPEREIHNGFAEMLKHGLIAEASYFDELVKCGPDEVTPEHLRISVEIKSDIVIRDPLEKNFRKALNFGHTIGHALESHSLEHDATPLLHGEALMLGMLCETIISEKMEILPEAAAGHIIAGLEQFIPEYAFTESTLDAVEALILHDKKNRGNKPSFTLLKQTGTVITDQQVPEEIVREALEETATMAG